MFRAYKNDLGAFVTSCVHSREAAEEVIQDLFLHLWEQRHEWQPAVPLNIYLFRAARNRAIDHLRHQRVEAQFRERIAQRHDEEFEPRPPLRGDEAAQGAELEDAIERAVSTLPPRCQEVFRLSRYHHLSYAEIAEVMQIGEGCVAEACAPRHGRAFATFLGLAELPHRRRQSGLVPRRVVGVDEPLASGPVEQPDGGAVGHGGLVRRLGFPDVLERRA